MHVKPRCSITVYDAQKSALNTSMQAVACMKIVQKFEKDITSAVKPGLSMFWRFGAKSSAALQAGDRNTSTS